MGTDAEDAVAAFKSGCNCAQSVFTVCARRFGMDERLAMRVALPFGGGFGRTGRTCGAVTGAFMVIGLNFPTPDPKDAEVKQRACELVREFIRRFEARNKTIECRELIDCDISTPEGFDAARRKGVFTDLCPKLVRDAADILDEILQSA